MNKKMMAAAMAMMVLAGCSANAADGVKKAEIKGEESTVVAEVTTEAGKITNVTLDEIKEGQSKKELGDAYGMAAASSIGKEWHEQIQHLEDFITENGVEALDLDEAGYAQNEDVLAGCTINVGSFAEAVNKASK